MADKAITDLNVVPGTIDDGNTWFAVAQSGAAYKVSGHEFILALTSILDGHGGIKTITYTAPVAPSLTGTLAITLADDTTTSLSIQNGKGITSIAKTGTSGLVDEYTITYNDSTTSTFSVTNGEKGDTGDSWYVWIRYAGSQPTQDSDMGTDPDNWMGIYSGTSSTAPVHYTDYDWFEIKGEKGDQGDPSSIVSQSVTYQEGTTPNIQPSGTWTTTIPAVAQGNYLWTKTEIEFNSGSPVQFFSVARMGVDGAGSVSSVNGQSPDGTGNVTVTASDIQTTDSTSVQSDLTNLKTALNSAETSITALENGISIIVDGDTSTTAVPIDGYAYIKNNVHGLAEGVYKNTSASAFPTSGGVANSAVFTAVPDGGLNNLKGLIGYGTRTSSITLPYTAPSDGIVNCEMRAKNSAGNTANLNLKIGDSYLYGINLFSLANGGRVTGCAPIKKGEVLSLGSVGAQVDSYSCVFIPLNKF